MKVKEFVEMHLEDKMNRWFENNPDIDIVDIRYNTIDENLSACLVLYDE